MAERLKNRMFTLVLDRMPIDEELDTLFEAGCDDAAFRGGNGHLPIVQFDRMASNITEAVDSAVRDIESCGFTVLNVLSEDWVTLQDIADRIDRSRESVRRYALGERGGGGFPPPANPERDGGTTFYRWSQVAPWLREHTDVDAPDADVDLVVADLLIQVRNLHMPESRKREAIRNTLGV